MDGSPLTKRKIIQLIKNHDSSVTFVKPKTKSSTSEVWSTFSYICVGDRQYDFVSYLMKIAFKYTYEYR